MHSYCYFTMVVLEDFFVFSVLQEKQKYLLEKWWHIVVYVSYKIRAKLKNLFDVQKITINTLVVPVSFLRCSRKA